MTDAHGSGEHVVVPAPGECPQLSPDGRLILFAFGVVNVDGTERRTFPGTFDGATLGCSTWSPDGARIAVEGYNDTDQTRNGIYLADAASGGNVVRLTTNDRNGNDVAGDWSPDGKHIAFLRGIGSDRNELWVVDVDSGEARRVIPNSVGGQPSWSPDGQWLVTSRALVSGQASLFILVRPDGTDLQTISLPANHNWATGPAFSPDGTRLVFNMAVGTADNADIYTMKTDGSDVVQITDTPNDNEYFVDWGVDPR
jgi:Tol biopolymer transport system component